MTAKSNPDQCGCTWKGKTQGPRGWVELISKRDPTCPVHGDDHVALDEEEGNA